MIIEKQEFSGGVEGDLNLRVVPQNKAINIMNARMAVSKNGRDLRLENVRGTNEKFNNKIPPYGTQQCIGSTTYVHTDGSNRIVFALYNTHGDHGLYVYDVTNSIFYVIVYDSQITGGLNFDKNYRINRNMKVLGGVLYFCDGTNNEPRAISIEAGIKSNQASYVTDVLPYSFPLDFSQITLIRRPPIFTPNINKQTDGTFSNNFIANDSFEFAWEYGYYTNEKSVISSYSNATRLNKQTDTFNYVAVTMDFAEAIPSTVKFVRLVVRRGNGTSGGGNIANIVKVWDKAIQADETEITQHNNGTQVLTFLFYNDLTGEPIAESNVLRPYDVVPNNALTLEAARNRLFLGNITEGYDAPLSTSLSVTLSTVNIGSTTYQVGVSTGNFLWLNVIPFYYHKAYFVWLGAGIASQQGYYEFPAPYSSTSTVTTNITLPSIPPSIALSSLVYRGSSQSDVITNLRTALGVPAVYSNVTPSSGSNFSWSGTDIQITGATVATYDIFKTGASYDCSIVFYDYAMRKCGVVKNGTQFTVIERNFAFTNGAINQAIWTLSNTNALTEIPDWAYYYSVVRTLNLKTRFFVNGFSNAARYATKDASGAYLYTNTTFPFGCVGIAINAQSLFSSGLGYIYNDGDQAILSTNASGTNYHLPAVGQDGGYIIVKAKDIGDLSNLLMVYEIYTPYQTSEEEPFFEVGEMYSIVNPTSVSRAFGTLSDIFRPDSYALNRSYLTNTYFAEAMCPNDLFYQRWDNDGGKPNFITNLGRIEKQDYFRWSNTYIPNTLTNGLSTFEALNQSNVDESCGAIQNLVLTNKVQDKGTVMLAICYNETSSIYLGETQISDATGAEKFFARSTGTVGTINDLKGSLGTQNPESVVTWNGLVFWIDVNQGYFCQYSSGGLEVVSRYGMSRFFKSYCQDYLSANKNNLDNINGTHFLLTGIDPFHKEVLFGAVGLIYDNYGDVLPSYVSVPSYTTSILNRFNIYDQLAKTMSFSFEKNQWGSNYEYIAEQFENIENRMFSFKAGVLYEHEASSNNWNQFYGNFKPARICIVANLNPSLLKVLNGIVVESSITPTWIVAMSDYPNTQITDLTNNGDLANQEGNFYGAFYFDRLSPNSVESNPEGRLYAAGGDPITGIAVQIMLEFQNSADQLIWVTFVDLTWMESRGQKQIGNPANG